MGKYAERAASLFRDSGYNCAQAVFCAFCDRTGLDEQTAIRTSSAFGGGMGRMREVCGAVSGALMVLGMLVGPEDPTDQAAKAENYRRTQLLAARFRERHGSIICRDMLKAPQNETHVPEKRTPEYYAMRPCERAVYDAAELLEELLEELQAG